MNKNKYFIKNTFILLLSKIFTQFLSFLLLPLYTSYLTTSEYGIADLIITYVIFLIPLFCFQIESAAFRFLIGCRNNEKETNKIIKITFSFVILILFIISIILIGLEIYFKFKYFIYIYIYSVLYELYSINQQYARGTGKNVQYAISSIMYGILVICCNLLFIVYFKMGIVGLLLSYIIASFISLLYLTIINNLFKILISTKLVKSYKKDLKEYLNYSIPLIPSAISWWVLNLSDRTVLSLFINSAANGIYAISNKFSSIYIGLFNVVSLSWTESVSLHIDSKDNFLQNLYNNIIKVFLVILIFMIGFIPIIYPFLIGKNFINSYYYVPILLVGSFFNVGFGLTQGIYVGLKKTKTLAKTAIMCALINIIVNLSLVNYIGIYAAAISTCIAYFVLFLYQYFDINKYYSIKLKIYDNIYMVLLFIVGIIVYYYNKIFLSFIFVIISCILLLIFNYNDLKKMIKFLLRRA